MGQLIDLTRPDGGTFAAYVSDLDPAKPSVIVLQEWWGLNDHIKWIVDRVAGEGGFNAIAPDLYHGRVTGDPDEASHMMNNLDFPGAVHQDIVATRDYLKTKGGKVGIMGFCMGGALTIAAAARLDGFAAAVCYYGVPPKAFADPKDIKIPFQGHFGSQDDWVTPQVVSEIQIAMVGAGNPPELFSYEADHAFFNKTRPEVYKAEIAEQSFARTLAFFKTHLA